MDVWYGKKLSLSHFGKVKSSPISLMSTDYYIPFQMLFAIFNGQQKNDCIFKTYIMIWNIDAISMANNIHNAILKDLPHI